jgi:hypothetical protein
LALLLLLELRGCSPPGSEVAVIEDFWIFLFQWVGERLPFFFFIFVFVVLVFFFRGQWGGWSWAASSRQDGEGRKRCLW